MLYRGRCFLMSVFSRSSASSSVFVTIVSISRWRREQGLRLGVLRPRVEVRGDPFAQRTGLADVEDLAPFAAEEVDARGVGQILRRAAGLDHGVSLTPMARGAQPRRGQYDARRADERVPLLLHAGRARHSGLSQVRRARSSGGRPASTRASVPSRPSRARPSGPRRSPRCCSSSRASRAPATGYEARGARRPRGLPAP